LCKLQAAGAPVRDPIRTLLVSPLPATRWIGAYSLARLGEFSQAVIEILLAALGSPDPDVRWAAADLLAEARAVSQIQTAALLREGTPLQLKMTTYMIRRLGYSSAQLDDALLWRLETGDVHLRVAILCCLAERGFDRQRVAEQMLLP
jgi:HEAT repeat protein